MMLGHFPCKNLLQVGVGDREGICQVTGDWAWRSDDVSDCPYREDMFKRWTKKY